MVGFVYLEDDGVAGFVIGSGKPRSRLSRTQRMIEEQVEAYYRPMVFSVTQTRT